MLTDEQKRIVEENHNLIYWYMNLKKLDYEEYYGLLAIELCKSVMTHDDSRGALSNFFKTRCDSLLRNEHRNKQRHKRVADESSCTYVDEWYVPPSMSIEDKMYLEQWIESDDKGVLKLIGQGYTQKEVAKMLNISQSWVSNILAKLKEEYLRNDR